MRRTQCACIGMAVVSAITLWVGSVEGRVSQGEKPAARTADIERGEQLFAVKCAGCHGLEGDEIPDINLLKGEFKRPYTDRQLVTIIRNGIPSTPMVPRSDLAQDEVTLIVKYLRWAASEPSPAEAASTASLTGHPASGKDIYERKGSCAGCHQIQGVGGMLGPALSNTGATRQPMELEHVLTDPEASIAPVTDGDGRLVVGRLLVQDTRSLPLMTQNGRVRSFLKADLRHVEIQTTLYMPS